MKKISLSMLFCLSLIITGISCGGSSESSSNDSGDKAEANAYDTSLLKITSLKTTNGTVFKAGRTNKVIVGINSGSDTTATDIPITFYIMPDDKTVEDTSGEETIYSGTYIIPQITSGDGEYTVTINVPVIDGSYGSYKVIACFYDQVMQSPTVDENNNISDDPVEPVVNENATIGELEVPIDPTTSALPDIFISKAELNSDGLTLFKNSASPLNGNSDLSININTQVLAKDVTNATLKFRLQSLDKNLDLPLRAKLPNGSFADSIEVGTMIKYNEMVLSYSLDIAEHVETLVNFVEANQTVDKKYEFVIVSEISSPEETDDGNDFENNTVNSSFWIIADDSVFLPEDNIRDYGFDWSKKVGNAYIGGGIVLSSHTGMDANKIYTKNIAKAPFSILKKEFNVFDIYVKGNLHYESNPSDRISVKFCVPEVVNFVYDKPAYIDWKTSRIRDINGIVTDLHNVPVETATVNLDYFNGTPRDSGQYYVHKEYEGSYFVMVGPIPVTFGWSVSGYSGLEAFARLGTTCAAGFIPYAGFTAGAYGGIGCPIARVTIDMEVTLITLTMENIAWLEYKYLTYADNHHAFEFLTNVYSGIDMTFLKGRLYLEARYPGIKWKKKKWGRYPVPCIITKEKTIYEYGGIINTFAIIPRSQFEFKIPID